jgi:hypothetical protein
MLDYPVSLALKTGIENASHTEQKESAIKLAGCDVDRDDKLRTKSLSDEMKYELFQIKQMLP